ncbi:response regulator [Haliangium ochraceum]|uniref:Response regulator receiver protein n=1 Tax=Haliangium ochraceum (strain DSM 14365 / JCM 11303 / SMP-2) TaxID=502025 RepID=D0LST4_HALO1|nr:response regulator [Haliangium ochraceum]ACY17306.1 response regulator receiver protein [Haliangium ochraceum DSM 14365]
MLKVAIFDDVVALRGETFHIPGMDVDVYEHADDAVEMCRACGHDVVFMDFAMGADRKRGDEAITALRASGFGGRIIAISSDPSANVEMRQAGADGALAKKAHLRSFLVQLADNHEALP